MLPSQAPMVTVFSAPVRPPGAYLNSILVESRPASFPPSSGGTAIEATCKAPAGAAERARRRREMMSAWSTITQASRTTAAADARMIHRCSAISLSSSTTVAAEKRQHTRAANPVLIMRVGCGFRSGVSTVCCAHLEARSVRFFSRSNSCLKMSDISAMS